MYRSYERRLRSVSLDFKRYLYDQIDWRDRLICIKGAKGTGKTTLLLQHIKETFEDTAKALYLSLDDLWFSTHPIQDVIEYHYSRGGTHIFLDEVHYFPEWQTLIKNIYDNYPDLSIVYSGSSMLKLNEFKGDLSRRLMDYELYGMSFREYLKFEGLKDIEVVGMEDLLKSHNSLANSIISDGFKVLPEFEKYLEHGYYPFYKEVYAGFNIRLQNVVNQILDNDYRIIEGVEPSTVRKIKKMFMILAEQVPQTPNMSNLYRELETDRNQGLKMLYTLEKGGLVNLLSDKPRDMNNLSRPDKIFLNNTNLMCALTADPNTGTMRETFFLNQLSQNHVVTYPAKGDFLVDSKYLFEVGGRKKSFEQIKDIENSFLAIDDVETALGNKIPLWMFGLLY